MVIEANKSIEQHFIKEVCRKKMLEIFYDLCRKLKDRGKLIKHYLKDVGWEEWLVVECGTDVVRFSSKSLNVHDKKIWLYL